MTATIAFIVLIATIILEIIVILSGQGRILKIIKQYVIPSFLIITSTLLFATTIYRSIKINFIAITNTFESLVFFSAVITLILFVYKIRARERELELITFGGTVLALILLSIASSPIAPKNIEPPVPALQSYWLVLHVTFSFIGESFFLISYVSALYYLFCRDPLKKSKLDTLTAKFISVGYPIFTAGALLFGAIWARYAWGSFWSWDPKETWALVTWLVYTGYLHARYIKRLKGKITSIIAITGFLFAFFTFFGVNFLLTGLHSYR